MTLQDLGEIRPTLTTSVGIFFLVKRKHATGFRRSEVGGGTLLNFEYPADSRSSRTREVGKEKFVIGGIIDVEARRENPPPSQ